MVGLYINSKSVESKILPEIALNKLYLVHGWLLAEKLKRN